MYRLGKYIFVAGVIGILLLSSNVYAIDFPKPVGFVNDFANILPVDTKSSLEATLQEFEKQTSTEISVVTVTSLEGMDEFTYSQELFTAWGVGKANKNNGILFLIAPNERRYFINIGKGLEGALTDSMAGSILRAEVSPNFKKGDYAAGVTSGVAAIISATKGEYVADTSSTASGSGSFDPIGLVWFGFVILTWLAAFLGRSESWWLGGVLGGVISLVLSLFLFAGLAILFTTIFGAGAGLLFDFIVSRNYKIRKAQGKPTDFWHSGGGFWFGGGRHGGFGGGGGFGGFGGGGSGGGGAGGGW